MVFNNAYSKVANISNLVPGFAKTGIFPLNPEKFKEEYFQIKAFDEKSGENITVKVESVGDII